MSRGRWFLPETPDVIGGLRRQLAVTVEGVDAFAAWARRGGGEGDAQRLADAERRGNAAARALLSDLRVAFVTPLEPEDVFALSRGIDRVLDYVHDIVEESAAMAATPDAGIAEMAGLLYAAVRRLDVGLEGIERAAAGTGDGTIEAADGALATIAELDAAYARHMAALLEVEDRAERIGLRELNRRCQRVGEAVADVAERMVYAVVKQA